MRLIPCFGMFASMGTAVAALKAQWPPTFGAFFIRGAVRAFGGFAHQA